MGEEGEGVLIHLSPPPGGSRQHFHPPTGKPSGEQTFHTSTQQTQRHHAFTSTSSVQILRSFPHLPLLFFLPEGLHFFCYHFLPG